MKILEQILVDKENRVHLIKEFQELIWNQDDRDEVLLDLALDLDYYEPDEKLRGEDVSYYGDEKLEQEIKLALEKLRNSG